MKECILLFQFEPDRKRRLTAQLLLEKFRVKAVLPEEFGCSIGWLAGEDEASAALPVTLDAPMLVMAGVTGRRVEDVLAAIKKAKIGKVPYKAVLTETNRHWNAGELLEELKKEHELMQESDGQERVHDENGKEA